MKIKHTAVIAWLAAVGPSNPSAGEVRTGVTFFGKAVVRATSESFPDAIKILTISDFNETTGTEPNIAFFKDGATASSPHGTAEIDIDNYGEAHWFETFFGDPKAGTLRAGLNARLLVSNPGVGPEGYTQFARADLTSMKVIADWTDQVIVGTSKYPAGTPITVTNNFQLTGNLSPVVGGDIIRFKTGGFAETWVLLAGRANSTLPTPVYNQYYGYARDNGPNIDGVKFDAPVSIPYTFQAFAGQPYDLGLSLEVGGNGLASVGDGQLALLTPATVLSVVNADFTKTLTWGGVVSVAHSITGEPIDDWTITSESGFDYARSYIVPEPIGVALGGMGLLGWVLRSMHLRSKKKECLEAAL